MQKITPFFWFKDQAEEAMYFYTSIFKNSKTGRIAYYGEAGPGPKGEVMTTTFELDGVEFSALNGGPEFTISPSISFFIHCDTQEEIDHYWERLSEGGRKDRCGWLTDKFGVTWQVVPQALMKFLDSGDKEKTDRVFAAMMKMEKLDLATLQKAYDGK